MQVKTVESVESRVIRYRNGGPARRFPAIRFLVSGLGLAILGMIFSWVPWGTNSAVSVISWVPVAQAQDDDDDAGDESDDEAALSRLPRLDCTPAKPRTVTLYATGEDSDGGDFLKSGRIYWYLPYTLTNKGDKTDKFFVSVRASSDKKKTYSDLPLGFVEKKVEKIERKPLVSKADRVGKKGEALDTHLTFAPGESKDCVAIFNPLDPEADKIVIDVYGLVNDIVRTEEGNVVKVEERVLRLTYHRPGDEFYTSLDKFHFKGKEWVTVTHMIPND